MDTAIQKLLDVLEAAELAGAPLTDTVIRESLYAVLYDGFVLQRPGYRVPPDLLLNYTENAEKQNAAVVKALEVFLERAKVETLADGLNTPETRERAFLDSEATSASGEISVASFFD